MKRCVYILPTTLEHEGITHKFKGQCLALGQRFRLTTCFMTHSRNHSMLRRFFSYLCFEYKAFIYVLITPYIYVRYNPKSILLSFYLPFLSLFKHIYIEHNTIMDTELMFLGRNLEYRLHQLTVLWFRLGRFTHIAVNQELQRHLKQKGLHTVIYAQNGYLSPNTMQHNFDDQLLTQLKEFQGRHKFTAIFCGNGYPWHGYEDIKQVLSPHPEIGLLVIGPYDATHTEHIFSLPFCDTPSLGYLIEHCNFAISTFRWDMLNITEGSPLKSRQYLCHGCPILVNYTDCASDFTELSPFMVDYRVHKDASFKIMCDLSYNRHIVQHQSRQCLSWEQYFSTVFK